MVYEELLQRVRAARAAIRYHRDQRGDDRCWLDDRLVWEHIEGAAPAAKSLPTYDEGMAACRAFYAHRRAEAADPVPTDALTDASRWDDDLAAMPAATLTLAYDDLQAALRRHRDVAGRPLTLEDDRALYAVLPERVPADFRLTPEDEFLGGAKPGSGCPNFWRSHAACPSREHDTKHWGPCRAVGLADGKSE